MSDLKQAALNAVAGCLAVSKGESVLVVTDKPLRNIGLALFEAACDQGAEAVLMEIIPRGNNGEEPPSTVARVMKSVDVFLCPTSKSLTHTDARREASAAGARGATLPGITEDTMVRCLSADYNKIEKLTTKLAGRLSGGKRVKVTSPAGTDIEFSIEGRAAHLDTGIVHKPGEMTNLPAGEAYLAPLEGTANGVFVAEASMAGVGRLGDEKIIITVRDGHAVSFEGGPAAEKLKKVLEPHGRDAFNIAELGIGTNEKAIVTGHILEDEKILGTVHMALGDNKSMGGEVHVSSHLDGLILKPSLWVDDVQLMKEGNLLV